MARYGKFNNAQDCIAWVGKNDKANRFYMPHSSNFMLHIKSGQADFEIGRKVRQPHWICMM